MTILGIETSCDETSAAVLDFPGNNQFGTILSQETATSLSLHAATGGIIPERAAREQLKYINPVINGALSHAFPEQTSQDEKGIPPIDAIAVTYGPGLIGSLLVGVETAKTLSMLWNKPLIPVNHLYGHIYANWIRTTDEQIDEIVFPALALVVSGGHTDLVLMKDHTTMTVIGGTRDDAAGEAFDKIGRLLGLSYPAGYLISQHAEKGDAKKIPLPRPMLGSRDYDFSFSGLKTAVLNLLRKNDWDFTNDSFTNEHTKLLYDLCASVQDSIVTVLVRKTIAAAKYYSVTTVLLGGGVAANQQLTVTLQKNLPEDITLFVPPPSLCTDNGAMIAAAGYYKGEKTHWSKVTADPELYF